MFVDKITFVLSVLIKVSSLQVKFTTIPKCSTCEYLDLGFWGWDLVKIKLKS